MEEIINIRNKIKKKRILLIILTIIIDIIIAIILYYKGYFSINTTLIISVPIILFIIYKKDEEYSKKLKDYLVKKEFEKYFNNIKYNQEFGLGIGDINQTDFFYRIESFDSCDFISGKYKNIKFEQSYIKVKTYYSEPNDPTSSVTAFDGKWIIFDYNKPVKDNILLEYKIFKNSSYSSPNNSIEYTKINIDNKEFKDSFSIYAKNPVEAFSILTPELMEKILKIQSKIPYKTFICFSNNKIHFGIHSNKKSFEPNIFDNNPEEKIENEINNNIKLIIMLISSFNEVKNGDNNE